jgi:hypothetical protein
MAPHECAFIFSNIETVAEEHKKFLQQLKSAADDYPFVKSIGAIFLDIKSLLNAISVYVSNFKNGMNELERLTEENPRFSQFLITVRTKSFLVTAITFSILRFPKKSLLDLKIQEFKEFYFAIVKHIIDFW